MKNDYYRIGNPVELETDRAEDGCGYLRYFDKSITVSGRIKIVSDFIEPRLYVEFLIDGYPYYVWKYAKDARYIPLAC